MGIITQFVFILINAVYYKINDVMCITECKDGLAIQQDMDIYKLLYWWYQALLPVNSYLH